MKERPILFSGPMVRAILVGEKTQTRRVIKPQPVYLPQFTLWGWKAAVGGGYEVCWMGDMPEAINEFCPYGKPGDHLWVRETWRVNGNEHDYAMAGPGKVFYRADEDWNGDAGWRPSIFMPRWASRITLEIIGVRVQRLQDITSKDAQEEGIEIELWDQAIAARDYSGDDKWFQSWCDDDDYPYVDLDHIAQASYRTLWDHINGKRVGCDWESNPWVWGVEFRAVKA